MGQPQSTSLEHVSLQAAARTATRRIAQRFVIVREIVSLCRLIFTGADPGYRSAPTLKLIVRSAGKCP